MGMYLEIKNILTSNLSLQLEKSYTKTCLPITASKAELSREKLEQSLLRYPKKWPFMDKILVLFFPSLIKDVRRFHTEIGPDMNSLFQEDQIKTIDETLTMILEEYLRNRNIDIRLEYERVLNKVELEARWEVMFSALKEYKEPGDRNVSEISKNNMELYRWVNQQRGKYKKGELSDDHIKQLENIGFDWDPLESQWKEMFDALKEYKDKRGDCNVPSIWADRKLVNWVETQLSKYKRTLSDDHIKRLEDIGFVWRPSLIDREEEKREKRWKEMFDVLKKYKDKHGDCNIPKNWTDRKLVNWVKTQRSNYRNRKLSEKRFILLEDISFEW